jgi:SAM-dependent methyltransferase
MSSSSRFNPLSASLRLGQDRPGVRLFLLVFLTLYLELSFIRFVSAEVVYLGYFSNFVLMAVFFGIGLGFLLGKKRFNLFGLLPQAILVQVAFVLLTHIDVTWLRDHMGQLFFGHAGSPMKLPLWFCLVWLFATVTFVFACISQETARSFPAFSPLVAYSIDIAGSIAGIVAFTAHAWLGGSPVEWFIVCFCLVAFLSTGLSLLNAIWTAVGVVVLLLSARSDHLTSWSPYQRIEVYPIQGGIGLSANGVGHQTMQHVGTKEPMYDWPHQELARARGKPFENVLIVGAGSGTDVAYALHYGAKHVDAVEIDPEIVEAGRQYHPNEPYADPRVTVTIDDGRAFMERARTKYDLVVFALPDSLAVLSGTASIRLESYLFTVESFRQARRLLASDGVLVLYNYYRRAWLVEKLADMLDEAFGHPPVVARLSKEQMGAMAALAVGPVLAGKPRDGDRRVSARDEWPFLYMQAPALPPMYALVMIFFVACAIAAVVATGHAHVASFKANMPLLMTGAAFTMLEVKALIQFMLLFGATWLVNALVFVAVLSSVLLANLVVIRMRIARPGWLFFVLLASLAVQMVLPVRSLLGVETLPLRYLVASVVFFSPVFFANLVFGYLFRDVEHSDAAFGWNIIGTMVGGALEYLSMAVGYRFLTLVVAVLYLSCAAWYFAFSAPRTARQAS